jgi:WD40 repeat protein
MAAAILLAACTATTGGGAPRTTGSAPTPRGWMLSSGQVFGQGLTATRLPDGDPQRMGLPIDAPVVDAAWIQPGTVAYAFVQSGSDQNTVQLDEVEVNGSATPVGDRVSNVSSISVAGSEFLVASCDHGKGDTRVIRAGDGAWRHAVAACAATLSPDGKSLAFSSDGHTIRSMPVDGGAAQIMLDLGSIDELQGAHIGEMSWGPSGLGIVLNRGANFWMLVHTDRGDHVARIAGAPGFVGRLRWQPSGELLAFVTFYQGQGSVMRAMDARSGQVRVMATDPRGLAGTVWAPDGSLLASLESRGAWLFTEPDGRRATAVDVDNELPFDWGA